MEGAFLEELGFTLERNTDLVSTCAVKELVKDIEEDKFSVNKDHDVLETLDLVDDDDLFLNEFLEDFDDLLELSTSNSTNSNLINSTTSNNTNNNTASNNTINNTTWELDFGFDDGSDVGSDYDETASLSDLNEKFLPLTTNTKRKHSREYENSKKKKLKPDGKTKSKLALYIDEWLQNNNIRTRVDYIDYVWGSQKEKPDTKKWEEQRRKKKGQSNAKRGHLLPSGTQKLALEKFMAVDHYKKCFEESHKDHTNQGSCFRAYIQKTEFWKNSK